MIDPLTAFSAVSAASSAISSAIKAGRDVSSLGGLVKKYAKAEAELNFGAQRKKNSFFSKLTGAEQAGIDEFFRKEELDRIRRELRSIFNLYGKYGQWERLQAEIANQRAMRKAELERQAIVRDKIIMWISVPLLILSGGVGLYYFAMFLKGL